MQPTEQLKSIQILLLDVDGVLTQGDIIYNDTGEQIKRFNVRDGVGIRMLKKAGIQVGIITGRTAGALRHRCENLGLDLVFEGVHDKAAVLEQICANTGVPAAAMAFMGDDLPDLSIMKKVGVPIAVADAHEMVRDAARLVTNAAGGRGAVREISEAILKAQGKWDALVRRLFLND
jgi:3-deoxy-D-manno-octulosonate 8-phosphate phosphatase (KDO 8-P phosphatase)